MKDFQGAREDDSDAGEAWDLDAEDFEDDDFEEEDFEEEDFEEEDLDELDFDHEDPDFVDPDEEDEEDGPDEDEDLDEPLEEDDLDEDGLDLDELDDEVLELDPDEGSELAGTVDVFCPYCGARVEMIVDPVGGDVQEYVEDCEVCCQPWSVRVTLDRDGSASVELETLDEG